MLNNYETMYIIRPDLTEDQVSLEVKKYQEFLKDRNVEDLTIRNHGKKRLAYMIGKHQDGIYVQMNYRVDGDAIAPMQRQMRISENVIRFLTLTVESIPEAPAEAEQPTPTVTQQPEPEPQPEATATEETTEETPAATEEEETVTAAE